MSSGSCDLSIKIWNYNNMNCLKTFYNQSYVWCIVRLNNNMIASGSTHIKIWNYPNYSNNSNNTNENCISTLFFNQDYNHSLIKLESTIIVSAGQGSIEILDYDKHVCVKYIQFNEQFERNSNLVRLNKTQFAWGPVKLKIIDISGNILKSFDYQHVIHSMAKLNLNHIAIAYSKEIRIINFTNGKCIKTIKVNCLDYIKQIIKLNSNQIVSGNYDGSICILNY